MTTEVCNTNWERLADNLASMAELTSHPTFSTRDEKKHNQLLFESAMLKKGMSPDEIRRFDQERLLKAAGGPRLPERARSKMDEEAEQTWRAVARGEKVRSSYLPKDSEVRANEAGQQTISYTQLIPGGAFVPMGMHPRAFQTMKQYDSIFDDAYCNLVETETGNSTSFPTWDDVTSASVQTGEGATGNEVDVANFGSKQLNAYTFRSGIVAVSLELLQDSNFPIGTVLERIFAYRHARGGGAALVNGSGSGAPAGIIPSAIAAGGSIVVASGASANDGGAETGSTSIGSADLWVAYQKLNAALRPGACWIMNDLTMLALSEQNDKQGLPLISMRKGLTDIGGDVPYLLGKPIGICPSVPNMASGQNSVVFYNPLYFVQRRVPSASYVQKFEQSANLATFGLVGFQSYLRMDSGLVAPNASFVPAVVIQNHS